MRYITKFDISLDVVGFDKYLDQHIEYMKKKCASNLGNIIAEKIGWEEKSHEGKRFELEVQCFSQKDWLSFKKELKEYIETAEKTGLATFNLIFVGKLLKQLEQKGLLESEATNKQA